MPLPKGKIHSGSFKKGKSGNPGGMTKAQAEINKLTTEALHVFLTEKDPVTKMQRYKAIMQKHAEIALAGDRLACEWYLNKLYGKPKETIDLNTDDKRLEHLADMQLIEIVVKNR